MNNPITAIRKVFETPEELAELLTKKRDEGFHAVQIWNGPGEYTNVVFVFRPIGGGQQSFAQQPFSLT